MTPRITRLDNGFRIVSENWQRLETVSVGIWVDVGSRHEAADEGGISHFIEHMLFKGTERRSARAIAEEIEAVGGTLNAYTSREQTTYFARVLKDDLPLAVDILSDLVLNSRFDDEETIRERDVILQELGQSEDTPDDIVFDHLQAASFKDQGLGRPILGSTQSITSMTPEKLKTFMAQHYHAGNMVLAAVGNVDHDMLVKLAEDVFGALANGGINRADNATFTGGDHIDDRQLEQLHLTMAFEGVSLHHPDYYTMQVFSMLYGGGMSSRLFQNIREARGLAYSVYSFTSSHEDTGLWGVYAGTAAENAGAVIDLIIAESDAVLSSVSEEEVDRAKTQLKAGLMMALESTTTRVEQLARQLMIFDHLIPVSDVIESVNAVDKAAVQRFLQRSLSAAPPTIATVGPQVHMPSYDSVRRMFSA